MAESNRVDDDRRRDRKIDGSFAVANRAGEPGIAGADAAGLSRESFVLCGGAKSWGSSSNGSALRGAGAGLWAAGGDRGSATAKRWPYVGAPNSPRSQPAVSGA